MDSQYSQLKQSEGAVFENVRITMKMCEYRNLIRKKFNRFLKHIGNILQATDSAEVDNEKKNMKLEHWKPCVDIFAYKGHDFLKTNQNFPLRCSNCGDIIYAPLAKVYTCQTCKIHCHSTCVQSISKPSQEIQLPIYMQDGLHVDGHVLQEKTCKDGRCSKCKNSMISFMDKWLQCRECSAILHDSCITLLEKKCPSLYFFRGYPVINDGSSQLTLNFKCPDCNTPIFERFQDCRYCYFSKKFFCLKCHSNQVEIIPENVLKKWCFSPKPVSDWNKLYLNYMKDYPVIAVKDISAEVLLFQGELSNVLWALHEITNYYDSLPPCRKEFDVILRKIRRNWPNLLQRQLHFSLSNLKNISEPFEDSITIINSLYPHLLQCHAKIVDHIRKPCLDCMWLAQKCMACETECLFPSIEYPIFFFERSVIYCQNEKCTPLNCLHWSCLENNPFFQCKGCGFHILNDDEFPLANMNISKKAANPTGGISCYASNSKEPNVSGIARHGICNEMKNTSP